MSEKSDKLLDTLKIHQDIVERQLKEKDDKIRELTEKNMNLALSLIRALELGKPLPQTKEYLGVED